MADTQTTTVTAAALDDMRDVLVRDCGLPGAAYAPTHKVLAKIASKFGSVEKFLKHYGHA